MYKIGNTKGLNQDKIASIENHVDFALPQDYLTFLLDCGYGEINENLFFQNPDRKYITNNFSEYMDLWDWENELQKNNALRGLTIAKTTNGDTICCVDNCNLPYLILPRHSQKPVEIDNLTSLFSFYFDKLDNLYFDSYYNADRKSIPMTKNGQLDKELITKIQKSFLEQYQFDKVLGIETQPKYVLQDIGGWVYFDLIYRSSIRVKYQSMFEQKAKEIIDFIERQI